jgi:WD40 repeat protein
MSQVNTMGNILEIAKILIDIWPILAEMHDRDLCHGEIEPRKIYWDRKKELYRLLPADRPPAIDPVYSAPERISGNLVPAGDFYSLGVSCLYLLTDIHPFKLIDTTNDCWIWRDYWLNDNMVNSTAVANLLDRLIDPDITRRKQLNIDDLARMAKAVSIPIYKPRSSEIIHTLIGHEGLFARILSISINASQNILASGSEDKNVCLWNIHNGTLIKTIKAHRGFVESLAFHPRQENILASGSRDRTVKIWDIVQDSPILEIPHPQSVATIAFNSDGSEILTADKHIYRWETDTGRRLQSINAHKLKINALVCHPQPEKHTLASASMDGTIGIWEMDRRQYRLTKHIGAVTALAFSNNGELLASGGEDRTIRLWHTNGYDCLRVCGGHPWQISGLAFSADDRTLYSSSWDGTVKRWQVNTGMEIDTIPCHEDSITCLTMTRDSGTIVTGSKDRTLKIILLKGYSGQNGQ